MIDYNIMAPQLLAEVVGTPLSKAFGAKTSERIRRQMESYDYYAGKQHNLDGVLVYPEDLPRPPGLDYDPVRFYTNYFKTFIQKKARWQMGGHHKISVTAKMIDSYEQRISNGYAPSAAQLAENARASNTEALLYQIWDENNMREKLMQAAKDRLIAGRVPLKIAFNPRNGKIRYIFRPDYECIPVYSEDDFEELEAVHFVNHTTDDDGNTIIRKQSFTLEYESDGTAECFVHEAEYDIDLHIIRTITPKESMKLDFIPVVFFPVTDLLAEDVTNDEIDDMRQLTDVINQLNEDSIDALKFEMFPMTAFMNVPEGTTDKVNVSAGATIEITSGGMASEAAPKIMKVESTFTWSTAFGQTYDRLKGALHEVTSVPNIIPQELQFGGMNPEAMQLLFHSIITETEEHWLVWGARLKDVHELTLRYLQARTGARVFAYDKAVVRAIGTDYDNEMKFVLPLPDNRKDLVELLTIETGSGFESTAGAMARLGVQDVDKKQSEIQRERQSNRMQSSPYASEENADSIFDEEDGPQDEQQ